MTINSIFTVTNIRTKKREEVTVEGAGEETIKSLRSAYPKLVRIVLMGFQINGKFKKVRI
jgi:hypothetical protein